MKDLDERRKEVVDSIYRVLKVNESFQRSHNPNDFNLQSYRAGISIICRVVSDTLIHVEDENLENLRDGIIDYMRSS